MYFATTWRCFASVLGSKPKENVVEDLISFIVLYLEVRDWHAVEKTSCEFEEIEKVLCKAQESVLE